MQKLIGSPLSPTYNVIPKTADEWKAQVNAGYEATMKTLPDLRAALKVKVEPTTIDGVKAYIVTPDSMPPENRKSAAGARARGLLRQLPGRIGHLRGDLPRRVRPFQSYLGRLPDAARSSVSSGARRCDDSVEGRDEDGIAEKHGDLRFVRRRQPDAGDGAAREEGQPAAAGRNRPGTPMSDLTLAGDTFKTNAMLDNVLVAPGASCDQRAALYTNGRDLKDPMLSPVYGDMSGFPPTILTSGTRDLLLSNTVRVHRKLRQAGVEASLQVFEGQSHAQYYRDVTAPETKEAFDEIAQFFDRHLGK
jgi:hypothetical protein